MKLTHTLATLTIAALTLVGCGNTNDEPQNAEEAEQAPAETQTEAPVYDADNPYEEGPLPAGEGYFFENGEGTVGKFTLPSEPVDQYEQLRESVDGDPISYTVITVDNRKSQEQISFGSIDAYDEDGRKIEFKPVKHSMLEWQDIAPTDEDGYSGPEWDAIEDVYYDAEHSVDAGQVADIVLTTTDNIPDEFTHISVAPELSPEIGAQPIAVGESWGIDLDFETPTN